MGLNTEATHNRTVNFLTENWREHQIGRCKTVVENTLKTITVDNTIKKVHIEVRENYDPTIKNAYYLSIAVTGMISLFNDDIQVNFSWNPLTKVFKRWLIFVNPVNQGKGIGTKLERATEEIARGLNAEILIFDGVVKKSVDYWRKKRGFVFNKDMRQAVKRLVD